MAEMTLQEAIDHAREVANGLHPNIDGCSECAKQHGQLADWLEELQEFRRISTIDRIEFNDNQVSKFLAIYTSPYLPAPYNICKTDFISREAARDLMYHNQGPLTEYDLNSIPAADVLPVVYCRD